MFYVVNKFWIGEIPTKVWTSRQACHFRQCGNNFWLRLGPHFLPHCYQKLWASFEMKRTGDQIAWKISGFKAFVFFFASKRMSSSSLSHQCGQTEYPGNQERFFIKFIHFKYGPRSQSKEIQVSSAHYCEARTTCTRLDDLQWVCRAALSDFDRK